MSMYADSVHVENLVVAALAVGGYSVQRVWDLLANLRKEGLVNSEAFEKYDEAEVVRCLARSGYDRGPTVTMSMANRLMALHAGVRAGVLAKTVFLLRNGHIKDAEGVMCAMKGVGPRVFKHFAMLEEPTK